MSDERAVSCIGGAGGLATNGHQHQHGTGRSASGRGEIGERLAWLLTGSRAWSTRRR